MSAPASAPPYASTYNWHHDVRVNGAIYPLRNRLDDAYNGQPLSDRLFGFTPEQSAAKAAVHELGHALVWLDGGLRVTQVALKRRLDGNDPFYGVVGSGPIWEGRTTAWAVGAVAGERAVDRWLREEGLWTPSRAAWAELSAQHDRVKVLDLPLDPKPGFGSLLADYGDLHQLADNALTRVWDRLRATLPALLTRESIGGQELATMNGFTYPIPPNKRRTKASKK
ncbi:hypothetical protein AB0D90_14530 [Streptomyces althioticus]|uniref:hypothetical protein n=1 Tax=Streptomyces althioticus TaxID=83380 RepID=UPI0033C8B164